MYYYLDDIIEDIEINRSVWEWRVIWTNLGHILDEKTCKPYQYLFGNLYWLNK